MSEINKVWLETVDEKLESLLADEARNHDILSNLLYTVIQLKGKCNFRVALINQIINERNK